MGYCISVCIEKGGVGKTVTVCNLAALMAQDGKRVLVVDMDCLLYTSMPVVPRLPFWPGVGV